MSRKHHKFSAALLVILLASLTGCALGETRKTLGSKMTLQHPDFKFIREAGGIQEYELISNGLKVLLNEDRSSPVVTVMVTYLVGSRNELEGKRGAAHLLEHMMFKGTENYQKQKGTAIAAVLQRIGAHMNASTWTDGTNYYETLPSDELDLALDIESERMRGSLFREEDLASEMHVVHSELEKIENSPFSMLDQALWGAAFTTHPYHFPVIGWRKDIEETSARDLKKFYDTYYWPNNACLAVMGDYDPGLILQKLADTFGKLPRSPEAIPQVSLKEPAQTAQRHTEIRREDRVESVIVAHKIPEFTHEDAPALDALALILTNGKNSRLYRELVNSGLAVDMRSDASKSHDPGLFVTQAIISPGVPHDEVRETILRVYGKVILESVSAEELANAQTQLETHILYSRDGSYHKAQELSSLIASGDWSLYASYLDQIRALTQADIQQAAQKYLKDENMTTAYLISKNPSPRDEQIMANAALPSEERAITENNLLKHAEAIADKTAHAKKHTTPDAFVKPLSERVSSSLVQGIRVLTIKTPVEKVVTITGSIEGAGQAYSTNPVLPEMVVNMLDEGTQRRDKFEIARLLERCGAQVGFQIGHKRASFKARCLAKDVPLVMEIVSEQLRYPLFDAAEFEKQKQRLEVDITHAMSSTSDQAESAVSRMIYPLGHPYYEPPFEDQLIALKKLTREDLIRFHETQYNPKNIIIVAAGEVDTRIFTQTIEEGMKDWPENKSPALPKHPQLALAEAQKVIVPIPDKSKFDVVMGHYLPVKYGDPLYYSIFLANFILGGDFSSRLSNKVRDEYGLTYSIYSEISGVDRNNGGHWQISMILNPTVLDRGIEAALEEIKLYIAQRPSEQEVEDNKATLKGMYQVSLSTTEGIASRILANEEMDLPLSHLDNYPNLISAITPEQVNQAIKTYFQPEKFQIACAGPEEEK